MDETFEKIYNENNTGLNEDTALFEKVYAEAEMLNEMNPKLRALLATGLIGTAGLGAASCSVDGSYDESPVEQPAETEDAEEVALSGFKELGVEEHAESLAKTKEDPTVYEQIASLGNQFDEYIYKDKELGFISLKVNKNNQYEDKQTYIRYINLSTLEIFYVPINMRPDFNKAITVYKAAHAK